MAFTDADRAKGRPGINAAAAAKSRLVNAHRAEYASILGEERVRRGLSASQAQTKMRALLTPEQIQARAAKHAKLAREYQEMIG